MALVHALTCLGRAHAIRRGWLRRPNSRRQAAMTNKSNDPDHPGTEAHRPRSFAGRPATITDVAREAGTGKTSISRYLNGETGVLSRDLLGRIEAAIAKLDYRPN